MNPLDGLRAARIVLCKYIENRKVSDKKRYDQICSSLKLLKYDYEFTLLFFSHIDKYHRNS